MQRVSLFSFKESVVITAGILAVCLISPYFKDFLHSIRENKEEIKEMEDITELLENHTPEICTESDFSDISTSYADELNKYRNLFNI
jgi:hypothetical protein